MSTESWLLQIRFPWCKDCKSSDQIFLKASSAAKVHVDVASSQCEVRARKSKEWKKVGAVHYNH